MISFPGSKINLGLNVLGKRDDGFHEIESVFYPIPYTDVIEVVPSDGGGQFNQTGLNVPGGVDTNLCVRAYDRLAHRLDEHLKIHLHKIVPVGAGLGGGSADATAVLKMLNELGHLDLGKEGLENEAAELGSDCPFFVDKKPKYITGRGEIMEDINVDLSGLSIVVVHPDLHMPTKKAYEMVPKTEAAVDLKAIISQPIVSWKGKVTNAFEKPVFEVYPEVADLKEELYKKGAVFSLMSGSGSSVFGLFEDAIPDLELPGNYSVWAKKL